jgi:hypothetical protein
MALSEAEGEELMAAQSQLARDATPWRLDVNEEQCSLPTRLCSSLLIQSMRVCLSLLFPRATRSRPAA